MLWTLLLLFAAVNATIDHGTLVNETDYQASPFGPQSSMEADIAMHAIHGESDDIRFSEGWTQSAGLKDESLRWPGYPGRATVPYEIEPFLKNYEHLIEKAIDQYHRHTCIRFVKRTNEEDFVKIIDGYGCYSYLGRQGGAQELSLDSGCLYVGTIVHELGHAIGLHHEHQRSDRDRYLTIYEDNISPRQRHNFKKQPANEEITAGRYDYTSIMHYGNYAFSKQHKKLKTMVAKNGTPLKEPYERPGLNQNDIRQIRKLYKC